MRRKIDILIFSCIAIILAGVLTWSIIGCSKGNKEGKGGTGTAEQAVNLRLGADNSTATVGDPITLEATVFSSTGTGIEGVNISFRLVSRSTPPQGMMPPSKDAPSINKVEKVEKNASVQGVVSEPKGSLKAVGKDAVLKEQGEVNLKALNEVGSLNELYERNLMPQSNDVINLDDIEEGAVIAKATTNSLGIASIKVTSTIPSSTYSLDFITDSNQVSNLVTIKFLPMAGLACYLTIDEFVGDKPTDELDKNGKTDLFLWLVTPQGTEQIGYDSPKTLVPVAPGAIQNYLYMDAYLLQQVSGENTFTRIANEKVTFYAELNSVSYNGVKFSNVPPTTGQGVTQIDITTDSTGRARVYFWGDYSIMQDNSVMPVICAKVKEYKCPSGDSISEDCYGNLEFTTPGDYTFESRVAGDPSSPSGRTTFWVNDVNNPGTVTITLMDHNDAPLGGEWLIVWAAFPGSTSNVFNGVKFDIEETPARIQTDASGHASIKFYSDKVGQAEFVAKIDDSVAGHYTYIGQELEWAVSSTVSFINADEPCEFTAEFIDEDGANYISDPLSPETDTVIFTLSEFDYDTSDAETNYIARKSVANAEIVLQVLEGATTKPFGSATFLPTLGEGNVITTNANGEASAHFFVTDPGTLRIRGTLKDTSKMTCFNQNISYTETTQITYINPQGCSIALATKDASGNNSDKFPSDALATAEITVRCNYKPLEGAEINLSITPEGVIFEDTSTNSANIKTNADGVASIIFFAKTTDVKGNFTIEAKIVDAPGLCKDLCLGKSASKTVIFSGELYKIELTTQSNDPVNPNNAVLGDGKHPMYVIANITIAGSPYKGRATIDFTAKDGNVCIDGEGNSAQRTTSSGEERVTVFALNITNPDTPTDGSPVTINADATLADGSIVSSSVAFNVRAIYIVEAQTDDSIVRSDNDRGTDLHVKVVDTSNNPVVGVVVRGLINGEGGGFSEDSGGKPVKVALWYTDNNGIATQTIFGFCCGEEGNAGVIPRISLRIASSIQEDPQLQCSTGRIVEYPANNLVTWFPGPNCYTAQTIADPANPDTGEGEICHFERQGPGGIGQAGTTYDRCSGTLDLKIYQAYGCDMVELQTPQEKNDFTVLFEASGDLLIGLTDDAITEKIMVVPGSSLGYTVYVDISNTSGGGKGKVAWSVKELYNKGNRHTFNFSEDFCLKINIKNGSTAMKVGDSITLEATGGCGNSWDWTAGTSTGTGPSFTYVAASEDAGGTVTITVKDNRGDSATLTITVMAEATPTGSPTGTAAPASNESKRSETPAPHSR